MGADPVFHGEWIGSACAGKIKNSCASTGRKLPDRIMHKAFYAQHITKIMPNIEKVRHITAKRHQERFSR